MKSSNDENGKKNITDVEFSSFDKASQPMPKPTPSNLDLLLDIQLDVKVELGRTQLTVAEVLNLNKGSYIELNKLAGEPVDILVNNKYIAKGEVVVVDEKFGVRITEILDKDERIRKLR